MTAPRDSGLDPDPLTLDGWTGEEPRPFHIPWWLEHTVAIAIGSAALITLLVLAWRAWR